MSGRHPAPVAPPRLAPLARLPLFFAFAGRRAVIAGGNDAAAWKAELLSAAGADVDVYSPQPGEEMHALARCPPRGRIVIHEREWMESDFSNAAIAVGAFADDMAAARFAAAARACGVPVNVIDKPAFCDFAFGAIVNRSPLVIGISTDGAAPALVRWSSLSTLWRSRNRRAQCRSSSGR